MDLMSMLPATESSPPASMTKLALASTAMEDPGVTTVTLSSLMMGSVSSMTIFPPFLTVTLELMVAVPLTVISPTTVTSSAPLTSMVPPCSTSMFPLTVILEASTVPFPRTRDAPSSMMSVQPSLMTSSPRISMVHPDLMVRVSAMTTFWDWVPLKGMSTSSLTVMVDIAAEMSIFPVPITFIPLEMVDPL